MKITLNLDQISKTGLATVEGGMSQSGLDDIGPVLDRALTELCMSGWTFLLGSKDAEPRVLNRDILMAAAMVKAFRTAGNTFNAPANPIDLSSDEVPPEDDPESSGNRLTDLFRSWAANPKKNLPPDDPDHEPKPGPA